MLLILGGLIFIIPTPAAVIMAPMFILVAISLFSLKKIIVYGDYIVKQSLLLSDKTIIKRNRITAWAELESNDEHSSKTLILYLDKKEVTINPDIYQNYYILKQVVTEGLPDKSAEVQAKYNKRANRKFMIFILIALALILISFILNWIK